MIFIRHWIYILGQLRGLDWDSAGYKWERRQSVEFYHKWEGKEHTDI